MQGMPFASHWSATGFTVSGVDAARIRSAPTSLISSAVTSPARTESDWVSRTSIWTS
jgi:hypothetical protein